MKISNISSDTIDRIKRKSAYHLPNNPSGAGYKPKDIKEALFKPIIDNEYSVIAELQRVINELNIYLLYLNQNIDAIYQEDKEEIGGETIFLGENLIYKFDEYNNTFIVYQYYGNSSKIVIPELVYYNDNYYKVSKILSNIIKGQTIYEVEIYAKNDLVIYENAFNCSSINKVIILNGKVEVANNSLPYSNIDLIVSAKFLSQYRQDEYFSQVESIQAFEQDIYGYLDEEKLSKVTSASEFIKTYTINKEGEQTTTNISTTATPNSIPMYDTSGKLNTNNPTDSLNVVNKDYLEKTSVPQTRKIAGINLGQDITSEDLLFNLGVLGGKGNNIAIWAISAEESEKAKNFSKGGAIDKEFKKIKSVLNGLDEQLVEIISGGGV